MKIMVVSFRYGKFSLAASLAACGMTQAIAL